MKLERWQNSIEQPRKLLCFSAAFSFAAALATLLLRQGIGILLLVQLVAGAALTVPALLLRGREYLFCILGYSIGILWCAAFIFLAYIPVVKYDGLTADLQIKVTEYAVGYQEYGSVEGIITQMNGEKIRIKTRAYLQDGSPEFAPGDILHFRGKLSKSQTAVSAGQLQDGIYLTVSQKGELTCRPGAAMDLLCNARIFAQQIRLRIFDLLSGDEAGLLTALISGDKSAYSPGFKRVLSASGTSHIAAVSGLHVSVLSMFLLSIFGKRVGSVISIPILILYAAVTGFSPSVIRAIIMALIMIAAFLLKKEYDVYTALALALLLQVCCRPFAVLSISLLLSFAAAFGIVLLSGKIAVPILQHLPKNRFLRAPLRYIVMTFAASLVAMITTLPLCMVFFSNVSMVSLLSNLLILWAVSVSMVLGLAVLLLSLLSMSLAGLVAQYVLYWPLHYIVVVVRYIGQQGWVTVASDNVYLILLVVAVCTLAVVVLKHSRADWKMLAVALFTLVICFGAAQTERSLYTELWIYPQDGTVVIMGRNRTQTFAVNCGRDARGKSAAFVSNTLADWGEASLDTLVITAEDYRKNGGMEDILAQNQVSALYWPGNTAETYDNTDILCYNDNGSLNLDTVLVELLPIEPNVFVPRILAGDMAILDLTGVHPVRALASFEAYEIGSTLLIVDENYLDTPYTLQQLCLLAKPQALLIADSGYAETQIPDWVYQGNVWRMSELRTLKIKLLTR